MLPALYPGDAPVAEALSEEPVIKSKQPDLSHTISFGRADQLIVSTASVLVGVIGVAIGKISNTFLSIRKKVPVKISIGTSALGLHVTILPALCVNLVIIFCELSFISTEKIVISWRIAFILAPVVIFGGQIGSMINSPLGDHTMLKTMMVAYTLVGLFVLYNVLT